MLAIDTAGQHLGWVLNGTWTAPGGPNLPPTSDSVSPSSGSGASQTFSYVFSDANGYGDISSIQIVVNETLLSSDSCYFYYLLAANQLYLRNDASSSAWRVAAAAGARPFQQLQTRRHASILTRQPLNKGLPRLPRNTPNHPGTARSGAHFRRKTA